MVCRSWSPTPRDRFVKRRRSLEDNPLTGGQSHTDVFGRWLEMVLTGLTIEALGAGVLKCATHAGRGAGLFLPLGGLGADPRDALDPDADAGVRADDARRVEGAARA